MTNKNLYLIKLILVILVLHSCKNDKNLILESNNNFDNYTYETPEDPDAPYVREELKNWIKANHHRILSLDSENFEDLHFMDQFLTDKSIVLLGEVAHGIAEQNRIRVRLIKYLHQKHGFNVVAFECGLYDCYFTDKGIQNMASFINAKK